MFVCFQDYSFYRLELHLMIKSNINISAMYGANNSVAGDCRSHLK